MRTIITIQQAKDQAAREANFKDWNEAIYLGNELVHDRLVDVAMNILLENVIPCKWYNGAGVEICATCGKIEY